MTYFPQPNPAKRARRVKLPGSVVVAVRSEGSQPVRAKLHELSATGGLLVLSKAFEQGDFVEVAFQTSQGIVRGMAELLSARCESKSGCMQPFRFVALDDEDHTRLRMTLESLLDQTIIHQAALAKSQA
jgi:c-di-GMP-binding flagellar brake protein YcgR